MRCEEIGVVLVAEDGYCEVVGWCCAADIDAYFGEVAGFGGGPGLVELVLR